MTTKERIVALLEDIPEYKLGYILTFIQGFQASEDSEDDAFCAELYEDYLEDPAHGDFVSFEEALRICGVRPDEL